MHGIREYPVCPRQGKPPGPATVLEEAGPGVCVARTSTATATWIIYFTSSTGAISTSAASPGATPAVPQQGRRHVHRRRPTAAGVPGDSVRPGLRLGGDYDNDGRAGSLRSRGPAANVSVSQRRRAARFSDVAEPRPAWAASDFRDRVSHRRQVVRLRSRRACWTCTPAGAQPFESQQPADLHSMGYGVAASCRPSAYEGLRLTCCFHNNGDGPRTDAHQELPASSSRRA